MRIKIERNQLSWSGHVKTIKEDRIAKVFYSAKAHDKRQRGRHRIKWEDGIKGALMKRYVTKIHRSKQKMQDRED